MTSSDQIKHDIDRLFSDETVTKDTARARLEDIIDHIEILIDSLGEDEDDTTNDEEDEDGEYKDGDDEDD